MLKYVLLDNDQLYAKQLQSYFELNGFEREGPGDFLFDVNHRRTVPHLDFILLDPKEPYDQYHISPTLKDFGTKCIVLTQSVSIAMIQHFVGNGVEGFLLKRSPVHELMESIKEILLGEIVFAPEVLALIVPLLQASAPGDASSDLAILNEKQTQIVERMARGLTYDEISSEMQINPHTLKYHVRSIYRMLDAKTKTQAVWKALKNGIIK